jgi:glycerophosphoryl diester phosphodiesterase
MRAALEAGADMIELDVKLTTDGEFVVFHDATLECRTDGAGWTHKRDLAYLKSLDIGYGYTADGGKTYPFRGQYIGAIPTLEEVITAFPDTFFMVNLKHGKASEGQAYLEYIQNKGWHNLGLTASSKPAEVIRDARPEMIIQTRQNMKACLKGYVLTGWFGNMPKACENNYVAVPANFRPIIWGWPHRFEKRLHAVGSRSMLMGAYEGHGSLGIDTVEQMKVIPKNYKGIVFTNKIEVVGAELK